MKQLRVLLPPPPPLDGMLVHRRVSHSSIASPGTGPRTTDLQILRPVQEPPHPNTGNTGSSIFIAKGDSILGRSPIYCFIHYTSTVYIFAKPSFYGDTIVHCFISWKLKHYFHYSKYGVSLHEIVNLWIKNKLLFNLMYFEHYSFFITVQTVLT